METFSTTELYPTRNKKEDFRNQQEVAAKRLTEALQRLTKEIEAETEEGFVNEEGMINLEAFKDTPGFAKVEEHKQKIQDRNIQTSRINDPEFRESFTKNYGFVDESEEAITERLLDRAARLKEKGDQVEKLITVLLHKGLGHNYTVVRSSPFDDYKNGVDNLLVHRETGEVIGAFDEVHGEGVGLAAQRKQTKILEKSKSGGADIMYGFTYDNGKLVKRSLKHVPVFYIEVTTDKVKELLPAMDFDNLDNLNSTEADFFHEILHSLKTQAQHLLAENIPEYLKKNIEKAQENFSLLS